MKKNKALIILSPAFPANEQDTVWLPWLQTLIIAFNKNYPELSIIIIAFQYPETIINYTWHNNKIIPYNGKQKKRLPRLIMWMKILLNIKKIKREFDIAGVFSMWCGECTLVAKYASRFFNLKYLCWILGQDARKKNNYVKRIKPNPHVLVANSDFLAEEFFRNHAIKPQYIIPNGIDTSLFENTLPEKDIDIIGVGSLSNLKRYNIFIDIIKLLKQTNSGIQAVLCGDGEERQNIKQQIKESGLENNIVLAGNLDHNKVLQLMQRSKIILHPSSYEGFPTVCLEALYAAAKVVSFVKPVHQPIKNWYIVSSKNEMYTKTFELLQSKTAYERVIFNTMDDVARNVLHLFNYIQQSN